DVPARFDEDRPPGAETAQRIVEPRGRADELGRCCRVEVRAAEARCALKAAVLVQDHAFRHERRPGKEVGEALRLLAVLREVQHRVTSCAEMERVAYVSTYDLDESRIPLGGPRCGDVADDPEDKPCDP